MSVALALGLAFDVIVILATALCRPAYRFIQSFESIETMATIRRFASVNDLSSSICRAKQASIIAPHSKALPRAMVKCLALSSDPVRPLASAIFKGTDSVALFNCSDSSA